MVVSLHPLLGFPWETNVIDLEDHPDQLSGERDLLLLRHQRLDHVLSLHVVRPLIQAVNAQTRVVLFNLQGRL